LQAPRLLGAADPHWGVDVGAAALIVRGLFALRDAGTAILVVSEDLVELFLLSDRFAALCSGRLWPAVATASASPQQVGGWLA
ncbi:ABC transporter ATP-binding protein, partial [Pseudomonas aeruginosa]